MTVVMSAEIDGLDFLIAEAFPIGGLLVSSAVAKQKLDTITIAAVNRLKIKGDEFDSRALPVDYHTTIEKAMERKAVSVEESIASDWSDWALTRSNELMEPFTQKLNEIADKTPVGHLSSYLREEGVLKSTVTLAFVALVDSEYKGNKRNETVETFATKVNSNANTRRAVWQENDDEVQAQLTELVDDLQAQYTLKLQNSLQPLIEPENFAIITNHSLLKVNMPI